MRIWFLVCLAGAVLWTGSLTNAHAVERSLLGIRVYANVKTVLRKFGNPSAVLTSGQAFNTQSNSVTAAPPGSGPPAMGSLPPLQPSGGPMPAFGSAQMPQDNNAPVSTTAVANGEVTLVYQKNNGVTYQFLLSPSGSVLQITALGYNDPLAKTARSVTFGTTYSQVLNRYGYPENQSESNGVTVVDYSKRAHVAFELVNNAVVGIVVAAID